MSEKTTAAFRGAGQSNSKKKNGAGRSAGFFVCIPLGAFGALLLGLLLLSLCTAMGLKMEDPDRITPALAIAAFFFSSLFCGYVSARLHGKSGFFCGALSGLLFIGILILSVFALGRAIRFSLFAVCAPAAVICAALAGVCAVSRKTEKKRRKHRF